MSKSETTNVDTKIKACLATLEAEFNQLKYVGGKAEIKIREYLDKNPVTTIKAEDNKRKTVTKKVEKTEEGR